MRESLLAVASNPPLATSGQRTRGRIEQARVLLEFQNVQLVNLFALPTYRTGDVAEMGKAPEGWGVARQDILRALGCADGVLLAYGITAPAGRAGEYHRRQIEWLEGELYRRHLPVYWVGGAPRHPSRWQRYTFHHHPSVPYTEALKLALTIR